MKMKRLIFFILIFATIGAYSQTAGYLRYDSIYLMKVGGNAELVLLNSTRGVANSFLTNTGNGRTAFAVPRYADSASVSNDTLYFWNKSLALTLGAVKVPGGSVNAGLVKNSSGVIGLDSAAINPADRSIRLNITDNPNWYFFELTGGAGNYFKRESSLDSTQWLGYDPVNGIPLNAQKFLTLSQKKLGRYNEFSLEAFNSSLVINARDTLNLENNSCCGAGLNAGAGGSTVGAKTSLGIRKVRG